MRDELLRRGARVGLMEALLFGDDARVEELLRPGKDALPLYPPNGGSVLNFARTRFAIDRLLELGVSTDEKDRWGATPIESISRLGPRGQALVRHLIARGVSAAPEEYARLGDRQTLESMIERDPGVARSDAVMMGAVDFGHQSACRMAARAWRECQCSRDALNPGTRLSIQPLGTAIWRWRACSSTPAPTCARATRSTKARRSTGPGWRSR